MNSESVSRLIAVARARRSAGAVSLAFAVALVVAGGFAGSAFGGQEAEQESGGLGPSDAVAQPIVIAQDGGTVPREIEPEYQPVPPKTPGPYKDEEHDLYTTEYLFGMTRGVAGSTMVPALKVPLFLFTIPLDIVFLPFEAIGGFF